MNSWWKSIIERYTSIIIKSYSLLHATILTLWNGAGPTPEGRAPGMWILPYVLPGQAPCSKRAATSRPRNSDPSLLLNSSRRRARSLFRMSSGTWTPCPQCLVITSTPPTERARSVPTGESAKSGRIPGVCWTPSTSSPMNNKIKQQKKYRIMSRKKNPQIMQFNYSKVSMDKINRKK